MFEISRREFLRVSALVAGASITAACAATTSPSAPTGVVEAPPSVPPAEAPPAVPSRFQEAPMLAESVARGELPPVDERLPTEPLVLDPVESVGKYGGQWTTMALGVGLGHWTMTNYVENFAKWERDTSGQRANLLTAWEWNEDGTEIVLHFRRGVRWSDGEPLTVDDWLFWWYDLVLDEKVAIGRQPGVVVAGEPMEVDRIDDYSLRLHFVAPNPLFMPVITRGTGARASSWQVVPAHYLKQYHYKYNDTLTDSQTDDLLDRYNNRGDYPDMPHFGPWITTEHRPGERAVATRNPYYWKVDPEGNQLPYIDGVNFRFVQTEDVLTLSVINGDVDFQMRLLPIKDIPILMENQDSGDYEVRMWKFGDGSSAGIYLHYCYPDPGIAELLWDQRFRKALSHAIDRDRINNIVFLGLSRPRQIVSFDEGPEFQSPRGQQVLKTWEQNAIAYDPATSGQLLDEMGIVAPQGEEFRRKPDGSPLELILDVDVGRTAYVETAQLIQEDWAAIGIKLVLNVIDATVQGQRIETCESMMRMRDDAAIGLLTPSHWTPVENTDFCLGGRPYGLHYQSGGAQGIPVPEGSFLDRLQQIWREIERTVDEDERNNLMLDGYQIHIDEGPFCIGTVGDTRTPVVVKKALRNVPQQGLVGTWVWGFPGTADPEQWYWA